MAVIIPALLFVAIATPVKAQTVVSTYVTSTSTDSNGIQTFELSPIMSQPTIATPSPVQYSTVLNPNGTLTVVVNALTSSTTKKAMEELYSSVMTGQDITTGTVGIHVTRLQQYLQAIGALREGSYTEGVFDANTKSALKGYQAGHKLPATGYFGSYTRAYIMVAYQLQKQGITIF